MNDRMTIAAMAMQGMLTRSLPADATAEGVANRAMAYADALIAALAESEAERPQDDQRLVADATGLGALDELTETAQAAGEYDDVGDWRRYTDRAYKRHVRRLANGDLAAAKDCFRLAATPQGGDFWVRIDSNNASALTITRAQDFARRVLEAMEASDE